MALQDALGNLQEEPGDNRIEVKARGRLAEVRRRARDGARCGAVDEATDRRGRCRRAICSIEAEAAAPPQSSFSARVAGLWPWGAGTVTLPQERQHLHRPATMPYLPVGALKAATVCYPLTLGVCVPADIDARRCAVSAWAIGSTAMLP